MNVNIAAVVALVVVLVALVVLHTVLAVDIILVFTHMVVLVLATPTFVLSIVESKSLYRNSGISEQFDKIRFKFI